MIKYTLHRIEDGMILQSGTCPNKECLPEKPDDAMFTFDVMANPDIEFIKDGKAVRRTEDANHD